MGVAGEGPVRMAWPPRARTWIGSRICWAVAVKTQWERAAGERGAGGRADPAYLGQAVDSAGGACRCCCGLAPVCAVAGFGTGQGEPAIRGHIDDLHAIYGGLGSGRLVIAGGPGSGKSGAAVLLVLAALAHRDQVRAKDRVKVPVPVLFTAQDWDPRRQPVRGWLTGRLQQTYPLFAGWTGAAKAAGLIDAGKLAVILDGLDEIAGELGPSLCKRSTRPASVSWSCPAPPRWHRRPRSAACCRARRLSSCAISTLPPPLATWNVSSSTRRRTDGRTSSTASVPARQARSPRR